MKPADFRRLAAEGFTTEQIATVMELMERDANALATAEEERLEERKERTRARWRKWRAGHPVASSKREQTFANVSKQPARVEDKTLPLEIEPQESKKVSKNTTDAEFDVWWPGYPEKVGKGAARKAFVLARSKASLETLKEGVRRYIANKPVDRSYCHPATWLNAERWLDEPAAVLPMARAGPRRNLADFIAQRQRMNGHDDDPQPSETPVLNLPARVVG